MMTSIFSLVMMALPAWGQVPEKADALQTVAERSGYRATARYDDVMAWCRAFAKATPNAHLTELGKTTEGRSIPLLIVADPPVKTAAEAARSGKLVCLVIGNIHAGEVCGKEALPMLLRDHVAGPASAPPQGPGPRRRPDLQRRRERARRQDQPPRPGRARGRHGPAHQCPRPRPQPRLHQARGPRDPRPDQVPRRVEPAPVHRYPHDQRLVPPLHDHLRRAQEPGRRPQGHRLHAAVVLPRGHEGVQEAVWARRRSTTGTSTASTPGGPPSRPSRGTAQPTPACGTGCRSCPRPTPMRPTRRGSRRPATSSSTASRPPSRTRRRSSGCSTPRSGARPRHRRSPTRSRSGRA